MLSRGHLGLLRPPPHHRRSHRSHQRPPRTPTQIRTRIQKPHPLHHPSTPRNRRIQTRTTPSIMKSCITPTISHNRYLTVTDGHPRFTKRQQHQPKPSVGSCFSRRPRRGYAWFRREPDRLLLCSRCVRSRGGARACGSGTMSGWWLRQTICLRRRRWADRCDTVQGSTDWCRACGTSSARSAVPET